MNGTTMSNVPTRRSGLLLVILFLIALAASIAWQWSSSPQGRVSLPAKPTTLPGRTAIDAPQNPTRQGAIAPVQPGALGHGATPEAATDQLSATMTQEQRAVLDEAAIAPDLDSRVMAIHGLRDAYSVEAVEALGSFLVADPEPRVRIEAAESLRIIAANDGDRGGRVRVLLQGAMHDPNPAVAAQVRRALAEVESMN